MLHDHFAGRVTETLPRVSGAADRREYGDFHRDFGERDHLRQRVHKAQVTDVGNFGG